MSTKLQRAGYWKYTHGYTRNKHVTTITEAIVTLISTTLFGGAMLFMFYALACGGSDKAIGCSMSMNTADITMFSALLGLLVLCWIAMLVEAIDNKKNNRY